MNTDMMLLEPYLFVDRLIVFSYDGSKVIDLSFHSGVNIIRGTNSSGKSTLLNFLFYGLGGDFSNWTSEARRCEFVVVEVQMSGARLVLRRRITEAPRQAMQIFYGSFEESVSAPQSEWKTYGYAQGEQRDSFSVVLFKTLGFPGVRTELDNSITMHQLLRLLYIDQDTPTQNLFRFERFDPPLMKQAVAELLLGIYDDDLYGDRIALREKQREHDEKERELKGLIRLVASSGNEVDIVRFRTALANIREQLEELNVEISNIRKKQFIKQRKNSPVNVERIRMKLEPVTKELAETSERIATLQIEAFDSRQFVESLERRVRALGDSVATRIALGEVPLRHCPECLHELEEVSGNGNCFLCKHPLSTDVDKTQAKRLRQELDIQIRESKRLLEEREGTLSELLAFREELALKARMLQEELDMELKETRSTRDRKLDEMLVERGVLESRIETYAKQLQAIEVIEKLRMELGEIATDISRLKTSIRVREQRQVERSDRAMSLITRKARELLRADLDRQLEFKTGQEVEVDFARDQYSLDGSNNFSASSNTYLKNAVRYAIFFASLEESFFRYPRFIVCDNMEDKGMEQVRTQNFQEVIVAFSEAAQTEHQIIFSTSMISSKLDDERYCVGESYTHDNKSIGE